jgi:hypothetical protein
MMKSISIFVALMAIFFVDAVLAAGAVATSVTGTVTVQSGAAAPHALRQGDTVSQGDTIATGAVSSAVLRFDDGEITALTANSRMQVTAYQYNANNNSGNVFLSLLSGGMRAITGLIGRNQPSSVAYRAATATIGIRGTTVDIITDGVDVVSVSVVEGKIVFSYHGTNTPVDAGQAVVGIDGKVTVGTADTIKGLLPTALQNALNNLPALTAAINMALGFDNPGREVFGPTSSTPNTGVAGTGSGGGGTTVSSH